MGELEDTVGQDWKKQGHDQHHYHRLGSSSVNSSRSSEVYFKEEELRQTEVKSLLRIIQLVSGKVGHNPWSFR